MIEVVSRQIESLYFYVCAILISTPEWHKQGETEPMAPSVMCLEWTLAPGLLVPPPGCRNCFHNFKTSLRNTHPLRDAGIYLLHFYCLSPLLFSFNFKLIGSVFVADKSAPMILVIYWKNIYGGISTSRDPK